MSELQALATQVSAAKAGSEYLDFSIQRLFGLKKPIPTYTRSLDAAMQLLPEEWSIHRMARTHNGQGAFTGWRVELYQAGVVMIDASISSTAATAPLALCAAALRARAAADTDEAVASPVLETG